MKKQRQNVRSTKVKMPTETVTEETELTQTLAKQNIMMKIFNASETVYSDQTGRLPVQSSRGNTSIMCLFDVDANYIAVEPIRSHNDNQMIPAYQKLWARVSRGRVNKPSLHILDNEASDAFKSAIKENCNLQLVPPDTHRRNLAERAIQTFMSHFIAILAGVDQSFPMNLWDRLLPQAEMTLNLLRQSKKNPSISAYQHVHGSFDYNKTPLGPLGCAVEMHESTNRRRTWDPRSLSGWYVGTSMEHYRCHKIFCKKTRAERISDTVTFQHRYITQPTVTAEDQLIKAIEDLSSALRRRVNSQGDKEMAVLRKMNEILSNSGKDSGEAESQGKKVRFTNDVLTKSTLHSRVNAPVETEAGTKIVQAPRVGERVKPPRVIEKEKHSSAINAARQKADNKASVTGPTTRSKFAARMGNARLTNIHSRAAAGRTKLTDMIELAQAIIDDGPVIIESVNEVFDEETGKFLKYQKLITHPKYHETWLHSSANEFGRLAQGVGGRIKGTNTIFFINKTQVPPDRYKDVTYAKFVCELKPNKAEVHRTRLTVGGDKVNYPGDVGTPTADLTLVKMHLNSVVSTRGARYMTLDVKNFYLNTPMARFEYVRINLSR